MIHLVRASRGLHKALTTLREYMERNSQNLEILMNKAKSPKSTKQPRKGRKQDGTPLSNSTPSTAVTSGSKIFITRLGKCVAEFGKRDFQL